MATHQLCTFRLDGHLFGVPVSHVQEVIRDLEARPVPLAGAGTAGLANLRGQIITALDARVRLQLPPRRPEDRAMNVVVRSEGGDTVCLLVDEIGQVMQVDDDVFAEAPSTLQPSLRAVIRGAFALDRELLLLLDTEQALAATAA